MATRVKDYANLYALISAINKDAHGRVFVICTIQNSLMYSGVNGCVGFFSASTGDFLYVKDGETRTAEDMELRHFIELPQHFLDDHKTLRSKFDHYLIMFNAISSSAFQFPSSWDPEFLAEPEDMRRPLQLAIVRFHGPTFLPLFSAETMSALHAMNSYGFIRDEHLKRKTLGGEETAKCSRSAEDAN